MGGRCFRAASPELIPVMMPCAAASLYPVVPLHKDEKNIIVEGWKLTIGLTGKEKNLQYLVVRLFHYPPPLAGQLKLDW